MSAGSFLKLFLVTAPVFFVVDLIWLGVIARRFYRDQLGAFLRESVLWIPAVLFYMFFIVGLIVFVIQPAVERQSLQRAILSGAFFGFVTYMTYELTNYSLLKGWPLPVVIVDIVWGIVLSALVSTLSFMIAKQVL